MRVLLDENLPLDFAAEIPGHDVQTVRRCGWTGIENGELMQLAAGACDAFVTMDQNLPRQQDVAQLPFAIIVLHAPSNRLVHLRKESAWKRIRDGFIFHADLFFTPGFVLGSRGVGVTEGRKQGHATFSRRGVHEGSKNRGSTAAHSAELSPENCMSLRRCKHDSHGGLGQCGSNGTGLNPKQT